MAKTGAVWGIDLGQCALKALRCRAGDTPDTIVAEGFDYVEYPKMLGQPDANPAELIKEALETFLSRNSVKGDRVAISVSGQSGLARFIKLPPVETKKIPDIVKYEAKQQIPFQLEDVVWDYQQMAGGSVEEGFALETEVGLFAMKRDQVYRALRPFLDAGIEIDFVQLTPVALYNFVTFDQMPDIPPAEQYSSDDPPPSAIVMSLGADMSDLVVTNGFRVWQRTVNLGGNHFTKALTKQMKLTFAKAEHLKRNAMKAEDPKAVFQAMRPVFSELLSEVQRSLNFFQNLDRTAKLDRVIPLGNAMKLRGLHKYLAQNLGLEVAEVDAYKKLTGSAVTASPAFKENLLSYGVCYGLCVQGLGKGRLSTNLLPREIIKDRLIRAKKPWAVAAVAALLFGCMVGYFGKWREWSSAKDNAFDAAFVSATSAKTAGSAAQTSFEEAKKARDEAWAIGNKLAGIGERRVAWAELMKAINECLPKLPPLAAGKKPQDIPIEDRGTIYVDSIDCQYYPNLAAQKEAMLKLATEDEPKAAATQEGESPPVAAPVQSPPPDSTGGAGTGSEPAASAAPAGEGGWVIQIKAHHYHNKPGDTDIAKEYVRRTLLHELKNKGDLQFLDSEDGKLVPISTKELGIELPVIVTTSIAPVQETLTDQKLQEILNATQNGGTAQPGAQPTIPGTSLPISQTVRKYEFTVQFIWKPTPLYLREAHRREERNKAKAAEQDQAPKVALQPLTTDHRPLTTQPAMDKVKHFLELARKHHFWILCGVSAVVGLIVWYMSTSQLDTEFKAEQGKIANVKQGLTSPEAHADWPDGMTAETKKVRESVWKAWNELYQNQKENVFVWPKPPLLNAEFIAAAASLEGDKPSLARDWRNYYSSVVKNQVRELAKIVDAATLDEPTTTSGNGSNQPMPRQHKVTWDNLQEIFDSFDWTEPPSAWLVKAAQEELWVYQALCKIIAEMNKDATGTHDAPVNEIIELSIAYAAAEDSFGGQTERRLDEISAAPPAAATDQTSAAGGDSAMPPRPTLKMRGKKNSDVRQPFAAGGTDPSAGDPDYIWKFWRYVFGSDEKKGKPMKAEDVEAAKDEEYNLMPFKLIVKVDPHYLDRLLVACRNSPLPIEVQQVRMGPQVSGGSVSGSGSLPGGINPLMARYASSGGGDHSERPSGGGGGAAVVQAAAPTNVEHERTQAVDIRGVVYLLKPPRAEKLHLDTKGDAGKGEEQPAPGGGEATALATPDSKAAPN